MTCAKPLHIAIVGGGIAGLALGIGLQARNINFTIYERASGIHEIGAGIGLSPNAEWAMKCLDKSVHQAYEKVANPNGEDYFQWVNGLSKELIFKLFVGEGCFKGCRRSDFLEELMKCLSQEKIKFRKQVREINEGSDGSVVLEFEDGTSEPANTVVGCDGIRSRVRGWMFKDGPPSEATYSHKYSFRTLVPMDKAFAKLGHKKVSTRFMYNGPSGHIITYPVASDTFLNVLVVVSDPNPWVSPDGRHTGRAMKHDAIRSFENWDPSIRDIVELMPDKMDKWAIFDMLENPVPQYHDGGRVCLAGDAAHAVGPHLGAGAGFGIEDACLLAELLKAVQDEQANGVPFTRSLEAAFAVFSDVRHERTQWLVRETRSAVDLFQWKDPAASKDSEIFGKEITWRFHKIWYYDIDGMVEEGRTKFAHRLRQS